MQARNKIKITTVSVVNIPLPIQSTQEAMQSTTIQALGTRGSSIIISSPNSPEIQPHPKCTHVEWSLFPMPRSPIRDPFTTHFHTNLHELFTTLDQFAASNRKQENKQGNKENNEQENEPGNKEINEQENKQENEGNNELPAEPEDNILQDRNQQSLQDTLFSYPFDSAKPLHKDFSNPHNAIVSNATQFCNCCGFQGVLPVHYYLFEPSQYCHSCAHDLI
jgi:hypothetical protein